MEAKQLYEQLDRIRSLIHAAELPDGTLKIHDPKIEIVLELCETTIRQAVAAENFVEGSFD